MRVSTEKRQDGIYISIKLDPDEYERLRRGDSAGGWDLGDQKVHKMSAPTGEIAVFLEALGNYVASYARSMSPS
jgi:hypothetical protein